MRRLIIVALIALIGVMPFTLSTNAYAQTPAQSQTTAKSDYRLVAVGAGAILHRGNNRDDAAHIRV